ncbi:hypothetical protein CR513_22441, partial [Mucuna pruriens]
MARRDKSPKKGSDSSLGQKETTSTHTPMALGTSNIKWFKCLGKGHIPFECPNRRFMIVKDDGEIETSEKLVKKQDLPTFVHPRPCKLQWLSERGELLADKQAEVVDDGVTNRFTFVHLVQRMMCMWIKRKESLQVDPWEVRRVLLAKREPLFAFPTDMLLNASPYLNDLPNVYHGLPPLRGIEHHTYIILEATLPNKSA